MDVAVLGLLLTIGFTSRPASAQVDLGVAGLVNFGRLSSDAQVEPLDLTESDFMATQAFWGAGGLVKYAFNDRLALVAEPTYLRKGAKIEGSRTVSVGGAQVTTEAEGEISGPYLELPLLLRLDLASARVRPYLLAGPSLGVRLGDLEADYTVRARLGGEQLFEQRIESGDSTDVASTDFSVALGGGLAFPLGRGSAFVEAQYLLGLTDIDTTSEAAVKHRGAHVRVGISFPVGGR